MSTLAEILAAAQAEGAEPAPKPVVVAAEPSRQPAHVDTGPIQPVDPGTAELREEPAVEMAPRGEVTTVTPAVTPAAPAVVPEPEPEPVPVEEGEVRLGKIRLALQERRREKEALAAEAPSMMEVEGVPFEVGEPLVEPYAPISERPYYTEQEREEALAYLVEHEGWEPHPTEPNMGRYQDTPPNEWWSAPGYTLIPDPDPDPESESSVLFNSRTGEPLRVELDWRAGEVQEVEARDPDPEWVPGFELDPEAPLQTIESAEGHLPLPEDPRTPHPDHPNVVRAEEDDGWFPRKGYDWVSEEEDSSYEVVRVGKSAGIDMAPDAWRSRTKAPKFSREPGEGAFVPPEKLQIVHGNVFDIEVWRDMQSRVGGLDQPNWNWFYAQKSTALGVPVPHPGAGIRELSPNRDPRKDYLTLLRGKNTRGENNDINAMVEADHPSLSEEFKGWYRWIRDTPTWETVGKGSNAVAVAIGTREAAPVQRYIEATKAYEARQQELIERRNHLWQQAGGKFYTPEDYQRRQRGGEKKGQLDLVDPIQLRTKEDPSSGTVYIVDEYDFRVPNLESTIDPSQAGLLEENAREIRSSNAKYLVERAELQEQLRPSAEENIPSNLEIVSLLGPRQTEDKKAREITTSDIQRVLSEDVITLDELRLYRDALDKVDFPLTEENTVSFWSQVSDFAEESDLTPRTIAIAQDLFDREFKYLKSNLPEGGVATGRLAQAIETIDAELSALDTRDSELDQIIASGTPKEKADAGIEKNKNEETRAEKKAKKEQLTTRKHSGAYGRSGLWSKEEGWTWPGVAQAMTGPDIAPGRGEGWVRPAILGALPEGLRGPTEPTIIGAKPLPGSTVTLHLPGESLEEAASRRLIIKAREADFLTADRSTQEKIAFNDVKINDNETAIQKLVDTFDIEIPWRDLGYEAKYSFDRRIGPSQEKMGTSPYKLPRQGAKDLTDLILRQAPGTAVANWFLTEDKRALSDEVLLALEEAGLEWNPDLELWLYPQERAVVGPLVTETLGLHEENKALKTSMKKSRGGRPALRQALRERTPRKERREAAE